MKNNKIISILLIGLILSNVAGVNSAALTDADDIAKEIKIGLDLTGAIADKKDAVEGAKDTAKKLFDEWTWDYVVANYEKLIFQNNEHDFEKGKSSISAFKEDINKKIELLQKIAEVSEKLGGGQYDEAAIAAIDQAVSTFDHPLVSTLWASVKMTYESHKLVQQTGAELQIEALYGSLENDRKIMGSSGNNGPKLFNMDAATVDYILNKYLITNDTSREQVKAYVKVKLGEDFPEASYLESFTGWITGTDSAKEAELAKLEEFKNNSRRWIMELLKDMNKEAKTRYDEARVRQELAEFNRFAEKFKGLNNSLESILEEFKQQKLIKAESKKFPEIIAESKKERTNLETELTKLKPSNITKKQELYSKSCDWRVKSYIYSAKALKINDKTNSDQFEKEMYDWIKVRDKIYLQIKQDKDKIVESTVADAVSTQSSYTNEALAYFNANLKPLIVPYIWQDDLENIKQEYLSALNKNETPEKLYKIMSKFIKIPSYGVIPDSNYELDAYYNDIQAKINNFVSEHPFQSSDIDPKPDINGNKYLKCSVSWSFLADGNNRSCSVDNALKIAVNATQNMHKEQQTEYLNAINFIKDADNAFSDLRTARVNQAQQIRSLISQFKTRLPLISNDPPYNGQIPEIWGLQRENEYSKNNFAVENQYIEFNNMKISDISGWFKFQIDNINTGVESLKSTINNMEPEIALTTNKWKKASEEWIQTEQSLKLDELDYQEMGFFAGFTKKEMEVYSTAALNAAQYSAELNSIYTNLKTAAESKISQNDLESAWIGTIKESWDKWLKNKIEAGLLVESKDRYSDIGFPLFKYLYGMTYLEKPYPHYLQKSEIDAFYNQLNSTINTEKFYPFMQKYLPKSYEKLNSLILPKDFVPAKEDNFVHPTNKEPVWKSDIAKAMEILNKTDTKSPNGYIDNLILVQKLLPATLRMGTQDEIAREEHYAKLLNKTPLKKVNPWLGELTFEDTSSLNFPIGQEYAKVIEKIKALMIERKKYLDTPPPEPTDPKDDQLKNLTSNINNTINSFYMVKTIDTGVISEYASYNASYRQTYTDIKKGNKETEEALSKLETLINQAIKDLGDKEREIESQTQIKIKGFYSNFKTAYESRSESQVMNLISNNWEAGDGTTLSDLESHFRRMFNIFDNISFDISNLQIFKVNENTFNISYDVIIKGVNYERDLKHEEKSTVSEQILILKSGKTIINKTFNGRFWYIN